MTNWSTFRTPGVPHPFALSASSDDWVIISGIGGHDPATGDISDDAEEQTRAAIASISGLLQQAGSSLAEIVFFQVYVTHRDYAMSTSAVIAELLPEPRPAAGSLVICELVDPRMKVELECWAQRGAKLVAVGAPPRG